MLCSRCGGPTVALFTSYACKHECDKPDHLKSAAAIAAHQAVTAAKVAAYQKAYGSMQSLTVPVRYTAPSQNGIANLPPGPPAPLRFTLNQVVCNMKDCPNPTRYDCATVEVIDHVNKRMKIRWLDSGSLSPSMSWALMHPLIIPVSAILP